MTRKQLEEIIDSIEPTDSEALALARRRLDMLAKPPGSLGGLEDIAARLASITGRVANRLPSRRVIVLAADNGVTAEGVSSAPQSVTASQTLNILNGTTGVGVLAKQYGSDLRVIDVGIAGPVDHPDLILRRVRSSTGNILREDAMTGEQALEAIGTGIEAACQAAEEKISVIGVGEMGIGNTTTSSAVLFCLLGLLPGQADMVCGRGAGLTDEGYRNKLSVIEGAVARANPRRDDPVDIIARVGGLDIAAMTGVFLGAARYRLPVVIDGFISVVAALCAARLCPAAAGYMFASHQSYECGYMPAVRELGLVPYLALGMRLGEGSGCPLMFSLMDGACAVISEMTTFSGGNIDNFYLDSPDLQTAF